MSSETLEQIVNRVLFLQFVMSLVLILGIAGFFLIGHPSWQQLIDERDILLGNVAAITFGCGLAIILTLISARSVKKSSNLSVATPELALLPVYAGTVQKLLVAAAGMALGLVQLGLSPIYVVVGFLVLHLAYVLAALSVKS